MTTTITEAIKKARQQSWTLTKQPYARISLSDILKNDPSHISHIINAYDSLHNVYFQQVRESVQLIVFDDSGVSTPYQQMALDAISYDAFQVAFEYSISWPMENFMEVAEYYLSHRNSLLKKGFGAKYNGSGNGNGQVSLNGHTSQNGNDVSLENILVGLDPREKDSLTQEIEKALSEENLEIISDFAKMVLCPTF